MEHFDLQRAMLFRSVQAYADLALADLDLHK